MGLNVSYFENKFEVPTIFLKLFVISSTISNQNYKANDHHTSLPGCSAYKQNTFFICHTFLSVLTNIVFHKAIYSKFSIVYII